MNMCVAMGLVPTKGLTLPFVSYGGTSLAVLMGSAGVLLSISASGRRSKAAEHHPARSMRAGEVAA